MDMKYSVQGPEVRVSNSGKVERMFHRPFVRFEVRFQVRFRKTKHWERARAGCSFEVTYHCEATNEDFIRGEGRIQLPALPVKRLQYCTIEIFGYTTYLWSRWPHFPRFKEVVEECRSLLQIGHSFLLILLTH